MRWKTLIACASALVILTGCANSGRELKPTFADVPADLKTCFDALVEKPKQDQMTSRDMVELVAALKRSEMDKSHCGKRLLAWIETTLG